MEEVLKTVDKDAPSWQIVDTVKGKMEEFSEGTMQFDDVTMLCFIMKK